MHADKNTEEKAVLNIKQLRKREDACLVDWRFEYSSFVCAGGSAILFSTIAKSSRD